MKAGRILMGIAATAFMLLILTVDHFWAKGFLSAGVLSVVALTSAMELCAVMEAAGVGTFAAPTAIVCFVVALLPAVVTRFWPGTSPFAPQAGVIFAFMILAFMLAMRKSDLAAGAKAVFSGTFAVVYIGLSLSFLVRLRDFPQHGEALLLFAIGCAKVGDMGAYFAGKSFGRRPLALGLSPNKTIEGAVGGLLGSELAAVLVWLIFRGQIGLGTLALWAVALSVAAQFGDLAESLLKRAAQVKNSSAAFATMGGMLDIVDSLLLSAPVAYILAIGKGLAAAQG